MRLTNLILLNKHLSMSKILQQYPESWRKEKAEDPVPILVPPHKATQSLGGKTGYHHTPLCRSIMEWGAMEWSTFL
jgi:hypothetical protein